MFLLLSLDLAFVGIYEVLYGSGQIVCIGTNFLVGPARTLEPDYGVVVCRRRLYLGTLNLKLGSGVDLLPVYTSSIVHVCRNSGSLTLMYIKARLIAESIPDNPFVASGFWRKMFHISSMVGCVDGVYLRYTMDSYLWLLVG